MRKSHCSTFAGAVTPWNRFTRGRIITILFNVSWLPFFTMSLLFIFCPLKCLPQGKNLMHLLDFVKLLHYGNSAINPVVYTFRSLKMRSTVIRIVAPCHIQTPVAPVARAIPLVTLGLPLLPVVGLQSPTQIRTNGNLIRMFTCD